MCRARLVLPVQANSTKVDPQRFAELASLPYDIDPESVVEYDTYNGPVREYIGNPAAELRLRSRP